LPKLNGIEILKTIRKKGISTPVILLTAKATIEDKILGLDCGADDYLPKPFSTEELLARLRALTRRSGGFINENRLEFSDIKLNLSTYDMEVKDNSITLTQKEFEILRYFMQRPKLVVSKDDLITKLWGYDSDIEYNNIEVYISFLRKKLAYVESNVKITTIRRVGYRLE
jgi:DNA-binding response OmpR family regulator